MKIWVDADACPVKQEIVEVALPLHIEVMVVASYDHAQKSMQGATLVQVDMSDQSVDLYIANRIERGDVLVTQDFGLAAIGLAKEAIAISFRGQIYSEQTIDFLLARRHDNARMRRRGKHTKGPKAWTKQDRDQFLQTMTKVLRSLQES